MICKDTTHCRRASADSSRLDPTHSHTEMLCFQDNDDPLRAKLVFQEVCDILRQILLHCQVLGEVLDSSWQLRQACNGVVWHVADVCYTVERHDVMRTQCVERDA